MPDIKSLGHQAIHSTQSAQGDTTQQTSEIVKENRPAEFRPLTNEQKESIKQSRAAESKFAEAAIKKDFFDSATQHVNSHFHKTKLAELRNGNNSGNPGGLNGFDPINTGPIMPKNKLDGDEFQVPTLKEEKVKKAEKFVPSIRLYEQPILDGEDEREEEQITIAAQKKLELP